MNLFSTSTQDATLIIDIGNGSVGVACTLPGPNGPAILGALREIVTFEERPEKEKLEKILLATLDRLLSKLCADVKESTRPASVRVVFSSPWFHSKTRSLHIADERRFIISDHFLADIFNKETASLHETDEEPGKNATTVIEHEVLKASVNGYDTPDPRDKKANKFDLSFYLSEAETTFVQAVMHMIERHVHCRDITYHSFPFRAVRAFGRVLPLEKNYIHFDVAGEITDMSLVEQGKLAASASFPAGKNTITREVAKEMNLSIEAARSLIRFYQEKRAGQETRSKIESAMVRAESEWNSYLEETVDALSKEYPLVSLPKKVFLTAYPNSLEFFMNFLSSSTDGLSASWRSSISIVPIDGQVIGTSVVRNPNVGEDTFLELEAISFLS